MPKGINKVTLLGNLGADPEVRFTQSGIPVANMNIATSEKWKDKQTGQMQERTEWHKLVLWKGLAEIAQKYLHKGSRVYIEGKLQTRKWQAQDGTDRYSTEIVVTDLSLEGAPSQGANQPAQGAQQSPPNNPSGYNQPAPPTQQPAAQQPHAAPSPYQQNPNSQQYNGGPQPGSFDDFDDEIPF